jgi:hypothetical protein
MAFVCRLGEDEGRCKLVIDRISVRRSIMEEVLLKVEEVGLWVAEARYSDVDGSHASWGRRSGENNTPRGVRITSTFSSA